MDLNQGVDKLVHPVLAVWNAIGYDVEEGMAACGEQLTNEIAIECCLDADHLLFTGNDPEAHALCRALCIEHGVGRVVETLGQRVTLA